MYHLSIQVAAFAGVDLNRADAGGANAFGVVGGLLIAFDHRAREAAGDAFQGFGQQGGFTGARAGDQIQRGNMLASEVFAVMLGQRVVFAQYVLLDLHHAALADARRVGARLAVAIVQIVVMLVGRERRLVGMAMGMAMLMLVRMVMMVVMVVVMVMVMVMVMTVGMRRVAIMAMGMLLCLFRRSEDIVIVVVHIAIMVVVMMHIHDARGVLALMVMAMMVVTVVMRMTVAVVTVGVRVFVAFNMQFAGCTAAGGTHIGDLLSVRVTQSQSV